MAKKKPVKNVVVVFDLNGTYSLLDSGKNRNSKQRGPMEQGQGRVKKHIRLYGITNVEMSKRVRAATDILENGIPKPKGPKGSVKKVKKAPTPPAPPPADNK